MILGASLPSAGSFFTNPILNEDQAAQLRARGLKVTNELMERCLHQPPC